MPFPPGFTFRRLTDWQSANLLLFLAILLSASLYVGKTWSPSSYGHVLSNQLDYKDGGPSWGKSRPIRSDEWAVVTPLTQATINNGFERYNHTSLYGEDLRINYGLPIRDWGLVFKPTMWLYGLVNPAYAYSMHWFALSALFIVGYAWLFRWMGATPVVGIALAAGLYFTGFTQFWWNEKGPLFALFPWVILPFSTRLPLAWKAILFYWVAVSWILTNLYPPVQISLAFVGLVLVLAREPQLFKPRPLALIAVAAALAAGTAALYLWDYLLATKSTVYPGGRNISGGNLLESWRFLLSWFLPATNFNRSYESTIGLNISEIGTVGLYYALLTLCFLDYSRWSVMKSDPTQYRAFKILAGGWLMMMAWMSLPLPAWLGKPLLWNNVQPGRMQYAAGVLLIFLLFFLARHMGLKLSRTRIAAFCGTALLGWYFFKYGTSKNDYQDLYILLLIPFALAYAAYRPARLHASLAVVSLIAGILLFGRFNPLQPAWPIFNMAPNATINALTEMAQSNEGVLAIPGLQGAVANGLGFRSLSHVTAVPQLTFWRSRYPDMPPAEFNTIFNRYSHIMPLPECRPRLIQADAIAVPVGTHKFAQARYVQAPLPATETGGGSIDRVERKDDLLKLSGWGSWTGPIQGRVMEVSADSMPTGPAIQVTNIRADLPLSTDGKVSALSGFTLSIPLGSGVTHPSVCLVAYDKSTGKRNLLSNPPDLPYCKLRQPELAHK